MSEELMGLLSDSNEGGDTDPTDRKDEQVSQEEATLDHKSEDVTPPASPAVGDVLVGDLTEIPEKPSPIKTVKSISGMDVKVNTRPWDSTYNPWSEDIFRLNKRRTGFRPRFVDKRNIEKKQGEGWQVAKASNYGISPDGGGTVVIRKGMVLMEMPEEIGLKRDAYHKRKIQLQTAQTDKDLKDSLKRTEHQLGGSVNLEKI